MYMYIHLHTVKTHTHNFLMTSSRAPKVCSSEGMLACVWTKKVFFFPLCLPQSLNFFSED